METTRIATATGAEANGTELLAAIDRSGWTQASIERATGLPRGSMSAVIHGRLYAYPRLRLLVTEHLAAGLGEPQVDLHARLFPGTDPPTVDWPGAAYYRVPAEVRAALTDAGLDPDQVRDHYQAWIRAMRGEEDNR